MKLDNDGYPQRLPDHGHAHDYAPKHVREPMPEPPDDPSRIDRLRLAELFRTMSQDDFVRLSNLVWTQSGGKVSLHALEVWLKVLRDQARGQLSLPRVSLREARAIRQLDELLTSSRPPEV
jgi:hypothetical protein